ncbi:MAG: hypothetical protein DMF06_15620 [Verrucomicrobia bacterium]|nr:MAG: hypothetical protein DMF06_15620 [Verrucomicrobiota bacterium]
MLRRPLFVLLLGCALPLVTGRAAAREPSHSGQCLVVLTKGWSSTSGEMRAFERVGTAPAKWVQQGPGIPVVVGKQGLAPGRGLVRLDFGGRPFKKEGDDRAPAGIFRLSSAFGYAPARSAAWVKLPYLALSKQIEGVDDPKSRYYNQLVNRSSVAKVDWRSSEQMRRDDVLYKWGIVVAHNSKRIPGAGSCIFLHIWKNSSTSTAGCTAMPESDVKRLLRWLSPAQDPILVQMPRANYRAIRARYGLPADGS